MKPNLRDLVKSCVSLHYIIHTDMGKVGDNMEGKSDMWREQRV